MDDKPKKNLFSLPGRKRKDDAKKAKDEDDLNRKNKHLSQPPNQHDFKANPSDDKYFAFESHKNPLGESHKPRASRSPMQKRSGAVVQGKLAPEDMPSGVGMHHGSASGDVDEEEKDDTFNIFTNKTGEATTAEKGKFRLVDEYKQRPELVGIRQFDSKEDKKPKEI